MTLDPGDETHRHGDYIQAADAGTAEQGMPVSFDANGEIVPLTEGTEYVGVYYESGRSEGNECTVKVQGTVRAFVDSGVTQNDILGSPNTSASPGEDDNAFGTSDDQRVLALEDAADPDGDGNHVAEVLLR